MTEVVNTCSSFKYYTRFYTMSNLKVQYNEKSIVLLPLRDEVCELTFNSSDTTCKFDLEQDGVRLTHSKISDHLRVTQGTGENMLCARGSRQQDVEFRLTSSQIAESAALELHNNLKMRLEYVKMALNALLLYLDSLQLQVEASNNLHHSLGNLQVDDLVYQAQQDVVRRIKGGKRKQLPSFDGMKSRIRETLKNSKEIEDLEVIHTLALNKRERLQE